MGLIELPILKTHHIFHLIISLKESFKHCLQQLAFDELELSNFLSYRYLINPQFQKYYYKFYAEEYIC